MRLWAENLACVRGDRTVFTGISFALGAGEALLVTGRNGAGKSSLLRMIAGLVRLAGGSVGFEGGDAESSIGEQAHYLGHQDALKPSLTVRENLSFWSAYLGSAFADEALENVGLGELAGLPAAYLSAGQKRRLSLARLIAVKRPVWLLDEPTSALDAAAQKYLAGMMRGHLEGGGILLAAAHGPIGLERARELHLSSSPSPLAGEGGGSPP